MLDTAISERAAHLVDPRNVETLDMLGPVVQFLTAPRDGEPCVMRGTIPPGVTVPLHSHADPGDLHPDFRRDRRAFAVAERLRLGIDPAGRHFPCAGRGEARLSKPVD
ncbi:MAG: hypothetical protein EOR99_19420 [Mesorhizobium sp.]|nr:MAG: hypothetical protein EOR99_19420 [Mesorhizobium sp.]